MRWLRVACARGARRRASKPQVLRLRPRASARNISRARGNAYKILDGAKGIVGSVKGIVARPHPDTGRPMILHRAARLLVLFIPISASALTAQRPQPAAPPTAASAPPTAALRSAPIANIRYEVTFDSATAERRTI